MFRLQRLTIAAIAITMAAWAPIGYWGVPRTTEFSIRALSLAGPTIVTAPGRLGDEGQAAAFYFNETSVRDYFPIEAWSLTNVTDMVGVFWDLRVYLVKVDDGTPFYNELFEHGPCPCPPRPEPFSGVNFDVSIISTKNVTATWTDRVENTTLLGEHRKMLSRSDWASGTFGHNDGSSALLDGLWNLLPQTAKVNVTFNTDRLYNATISSHEVGLEDYRVTFLRFDSVEMTLLNRTALSASGDSFLRNVESQPVRITYRQIPISDASDITLALVLGSSFLLLAVVADDFWRNRRSSRKNTVRPSQDSVQLQ